MGNRVQFRRTGNLLLGVMLWSILIVGSFLPRPVAAQLPTTNALSFFTNLSSRLLQQEFGLPLSQVQIYPINQYTPAVHRLLQVTANLWEATANSPDGLPTVFRPRFRVVGNAVYLSSYVVVTNASELNGLSLFELNALTNARALIPASGDVLIYGVPLVIGARKGLPNFNEFQIAPTFELARKIQLIKPTASSTIISETNQFFTLALTMPIAAEFWNAYSTIFTNAVTICITNRTTMTLTNDTGINVSVTIVTGDRYSTNDWPRFNSANPVALTNKYSFISMLRTNIPFLPQSGTNIGYVPQVGFVSATNSNLYDTSQNLYLPHWGMTITNRVQAMILDEATGRIIDYVLLDGLNCATNLTDVFARPNSWNNGNSVEEVFKSVWATNVAPDLLHLSGRRGVEMQIMIAWGAFGSSFNNYWKAYGNLAPEYSTVAAAIAFFNNFLSNTATTNRATVPFTPTVKFALPRIWQANDPLVHYMADEMFYAELAEMEPVRWQIPQTSGPQVAYDNIGKLNDRYQPWGGSPVKPMEGDPNNFAPAVKDPGVKSANNWEFPTNAVPTLGWLGRVHRGTPWQTIYLKAVDVDLANFTYSLFQWLAPGNDQRAALRWRNITGNRDLTDGFHSRPVQDWPLVTLIQSLLNTNAPQYLLSINDRNATNWLAVFHGMTVLTNSAPSSLPFDALLMTSDSPQAALLVQAVANARNNQPGQVFSSLEALLAIPELSVLSPWLNLAVIQSKMTDEAYEKIPSQLLSLVREDSVGTVRVEGGAARISFSGFDGYPYAVERSGDLVNWISVRTNYPTNGVFEFVLPSVNSTNVFYRSVLLP